MKSSKYSWTIQLNKKTYLIGKDLIYGAVICSNPKENEKNFVINIRIFLKQKNYKTKREFLMKNTHDIAYEIERIAEKIFNISFDHSGTIFDKDFIEKETFYESIFNITHEW